MNIVIKLNESEFRDQFSKMNRNNNFSYEGFGVLYEYFQELSEDNDMPYFLDVIGVCCAFSEYEFKEALDEYGCSTLDELQQDVYTILGPFDCDGKQHIIIEE